MEIKDIKRNDIQGHCNW